MFSGKLNTYVNYFNNITGHTLLCIDINKEDALLVMLSIHYKTNLNVLVCLPTIFFLPNNV